MSFYYNGMIGGHLTKQSELPKGITLDQVTRFAATAIIVNDQNQVLMMMRDDCPAWINIGGLVDAGENFEQALHRETMEEANIEIDVFAFGGNYFTPISKSSSLEYKHDKTYICHIKADQKPILGNEGVAVKWFSLNNLPKNIPPRYISKMKDIQENKTVSRILIFPSTREFIKTCDTESIHMLDVWRKHPRVLEKKARGALKYWPE